MLDDGNLTNITSVRFGGFRVHFGQRRLVEHGKRVRLTAKPFDALAFLIRNRDRLVTKEEILRAVWGTSAVTVASVEQAIRQVRQALGDQLKEPLYIQTIWGEGYRFVGTVDAEESLAVEPVDTPQPVYGIDSAVGRQLETQPPAASDDAAIASPTSPEEAEVLPAISAGECPVLPSQESNRPSEDAHSGGTVLGATHMLWVCAFYATLYVIALILEVAYGFDRFGIHALALSPLVGGWMFLTTWFAILNCWRRSKEGLCQSIGVLLGATVGPALMLSVALFAFLPGDPVTVMVTPAQTAQAAYLKNTAFYFLPLAVLTWLIPFHFVCGLNGELVKGNSPAVLALLRHERGTVSPEGTVYLRPDWIAKGLVLLCQRFLEMSPCSVH